MLDDQEAGTGMEAVLTLFVHSSFVTKLDHGFWPREASGVELFSFRNFVPVVSAKI